MKRGPEPAVPVAPTAGEPIWVTGVGVLTALAAGGREAVGELRARALGADGEATGDLALGEVDLARLVGGKGLRHLSRGTLALLAAARFALEDAAGTGAAVPSGESDGVVAGTATATAGLVADFDRTTLVEGPQTANPALFPQTVWNGPACQVAIRHGLRGANVTLSTGMNSGLDAVIAGARLLRAGRADRVVAGGFEELTPFFAVLTERPAAARLRPRLSEGAALLVLERRSAAEARGARPLAILGSGASAFEPVARERGSRLCGLIPEDARAGASPRAWCLGWAADALAGAGGAVDLARFAGEGGGLTGALAAALAACGATRTELVAAADAGGRIAALAVHPVA